MAEILLKAIDATHDDLEKDRRGCYKRGMPVVVMEDGHEWGKEEGLPNFVILKLPGVSAARVQKYIALQMDDVDLKKIYRRRKWQIVWSELPLAARNTFRDTGQLTIKVGDYAGAYNYTWAQVKSFFLDNQTGLRETLDP